jgi:hypothetical protein
VRRTVKEMVKGLLTELLETIQTPVSVYFSIVLQDSNISQSLVLMQRVNNKFLLPPSILFSAYRGRLPGGEKRTGNDADYSPTSSTDVKNEWS